MLQSGCQGVSYQGDRQIVGMRHVAAECDLQADSPVPKIRKRDNRITADAQHMFEHDARLAGRLQGLRQDDEVEGVVGIVYEVCVGVALHHRKALGDAFVHALTRQLDTAAVDTARFQKT